MARDGPERPHASYRPTINLEQRKLRFNGRSRRMDRTVFEDALAHARAAVARSEDIRAKLDISRERIEASQRRIAAGWKKLNNADL